MCIHTTCCGAVITMVDVYLVNQRQSDEVYRVAEEQSRLISELSQVMCTCMLLYMCGGCVCLSLVICSSSISHNFGLEGPIPTIQTFFYSLY